MILIPLLTFPVCAKDAGGGDLLTDFAGGGVALTWRSVNDGVMGGRSSGAFRINDGVLEFSGTLNTNGGGFASLRTEPRALPLDSSEGIHLRVRGDGRTYTMRLQQRGADGARPVSYRATFRADRGEAWQDIWLPFPTFVPTWRGRTLDLPAIDPARIEGLGLMIADKIDGPFRLEVDSIRAYAPFSMAGFEWKFRPLVVFAPDAADARLARQLAMVREAAAGFRERDMILVVVLAEGTSCAGSRPLSAADAEALRKRFDVAPESFAVKLVGKDGGVKRSAAEPADPAALYRQIDGMPMRRAEMAEREASSG